MTSITLLAAALVADPFDPWRALAALLAGAAAAAVCRHGTPKRFEVAVDLRGGLQARRADREPQDVPPTRCVFAAPWLITLRYGTMWVPIWPDAVDSGLFRRLWVHARWSAGRSASDGTAEPSADR